MSSKLISKTIRLTPEEEQEIKRVCAQVPYATESSLLKQFALDGLRRFRLEQAIAQYVNGHFSLGEAAAAAGVEHHAFYEELERRKVVVMDLERKEMLENLGHFAEVLNLPKLRKVASELAEKDR